MGVGHGTNGEVDGTERRVRDLGDGTSQDGEEEGSHGRKVIMSCRYHHRN